MDLSWRHHAACRGLDPEIFYPVSDQQGSQGLADWQQLGKIVVGQAREWIVDDRAGRHPRYRRVSRQPALDMDRVTHHQNAADLHIYPPVSCWKFLPSAASAWGPGSAWRTKPIGSSSTRRNGASVPNNNRSGGTTVAAKPRYPGSKPAVS